MNRSLFSAASDRWATPAAVYSALDAEFHFDFDPCPLDGEGDGLSPLFCEWRGKRVFCNPPYGPKIGEWLKRGREAEIAVFLLPARTDTRWFHTLVLPHASEIRFLRGRLKFGGATTGAPFPSVVIVFRKDRQEFRNVKDSVREAREKRVREADGCDICGGIPCLIHEIARGCHRQKALLANYATLILCQKCHAKVHSGMSLAEQHAWLYHRRPQDQNLEAYWQLIARRHPSYQEVMHYVRRLRWQETEERGF